MQTDGKSEDDGKEIGWERKEQKNEQRTGEGKGEAPCRLTKHLLTLDLVPCYTMTCYCHAQVPKDIMVTPLPRVNPDSLLPRPNANLTNLL